MNTHVTLWSVEAANDDIRKMIAATERAMQALNAGLEKDSYDDPTGNGGSRLRILAQHYVHLCGCLFYIADFLSNGQLSYNDLSSAMGVIEIEHARVFRSLGLVRAFYVY